jgi:hypothetical protein
MFNSGEGYSLTDIAAASGRNGYGDSFMGNGAWWIIILFLFIFSGWGGNGFGGANSAAAQGALTRADLCQDMNFNQLESSVRGVQQGLCDGFYAMNTGMLNGFANAQQTMCAGFGGLTNTLNQNTNALQQDITGVTIANMQNTNALQQDINANTVANMQNTNALQSQIAQCCCDNRAGQKDIEFQLASNTCDVKNTIQNTTRDIIDNQNCATRSILDFLVQDKLSTLQAENQNLKFAASQCAQNNYLVSQLRPAPIPAYQVANPYIGYGLGYGCECGA